MTLPKASEFPSLPFNYHFEVQMREDSPGFDSRRYDLLINCPTGETVAIKELAYEDELIKEAQMLSPQAYLHNTGTEAERQVEELNIALRNRR